MPIRTLILACGAVVVISLVMAAWQAPKRDMRDLSRPANPPPSVIVAEKRDLYVETGTLAMAVAWRALVRAELCRVRGS